MAATPEQITPAEGATLRTRSGIFSWEPLDGGADLYVLQIATDDAFANIVAQEETTLTQVETTFEAGALYYWRVRAMDGGSPVDSMTARSFSAPPFSPAPVATHVADGKARFLSQFKEDS